MPKSLKSWGVFCIKSFNNLPKEVVDWERSQVKSSEIYDIIWQLKTTMATTIETPFNSRVKCIAMWPRRSMTGKEWAGQDTIIWPRGLPETKKWASSNDHRVNMNHDLSKHIKGGISCLSILPLWPKWK